MVCGSLSQGSLTSNHLFVCLPRVKFSKKNQSDYLKYSPEKVEEMLSDMYVDAEA